MINREKTMENQILLKESNSFMCNNYYMTKKEPKISLSGLEYGGMHFMPYAKLGHVDNLADILLRSDKELGFFDFHYEDKGFLQKFPYSHESFYKAMDNSEMDIFMCVENGKLYIPCEHELFIYEGRRMPPTKRW